MRRLVGVKRVLSLFRGTRLFLPPSRRCRHPSSERVRHIVGKITTLLLQLRVLCLGLLQDRNVGVGVFPEGEEVLIGGFCFGDVALHGIGSTQLEMSQYADRIPDHYPGVIQNFLEFLGSLSALTRSQIRLTTRIDGIESPEKTCLSAARLAQFIGNGNLENFDRLCGIAMIQRKKRTYGRQIIELN